MPALGLGPSRTDDREAERSLVRRATAGDLEAFRRVVELHQDVIVAFLHRLLAPSMRAALAEDLAQETFLRAFQALGTFDPEGPARLSTWLFTIASRLAFTELARPRLVSQPLEAATRVSAPETADSQALRRELAQVISAALAQLRPEFRAAFVLREYHGLEYAEIATALGLELGTVKSRLSRARAELQAALEEVHR